METYAPNTMPGQNAASRLREMFFGGGSSSAYLKFLSAIGVLAIAAWLYYFTTVPVTVVVNGEEFRRRTHQQSVGGLLEELGIRLRPEDVVSPGPESEILPGSEVYLLIARPVALEVDGRTTTLYTHQRMVGAILHEAGITLKPRDELLLEGERCEAGDEIPPPPSFEPGDRSGSSMRPLQLRLLRAVPVTLHDGGAQVRFHTTKKTVGEALLEQGIILYLGDRVTPSLGSRLLPGASIYVQRSMPVAVTADGHRLKTRTMQETVGEVLSQEGVALVGQDYVTPPTGSQVQPGMTIRVVRVAQSIEIEQDVIAFESTWKPDPEMELDQSQLVRPGQNGVTKRRYRVTYEDGQEISRTLEDEWVDSEPADKVIAYGTKIVVRTLETEEGTFEYWRKIRMLATSYSAATSGKEPDHPAYGITRMGLPAGKGIVAVDPTVINMMSEVYVPGYGKGLAADTGGLVLGRHIDLCFDEDAWPGEWYRWLDVYVLTPVPTGDEIRYVLPQWPQPR